MNEKQEEAEGTWLDRLDEIMDGIDEPSSDDDELLQLARHIRVALAPLRELDAPARAYRQRLKGQLRAKLATRTRSWQRWVFRPLMVAAALMLFIFLGPGLIFELNLAGQNARSGANVQGWHMPDLPPANSYEMLARNRMPPNLALLVPTNLLPNAYLLAINTSAYQANTSTRDYLIYEQNALIYEAPSPPLPTIAYTDSAYQILYAGNIPVFVMPASGGNTRLEWYQNGLLCDFVSNQPFEQSLLMIQQLQLVAY
jgi:hypothetical protein